MESLLIVGIAVIYGYIGGRLINRLKLPAVVGYILVGLILGPSLLHIFELDILDRMGVVIDLALGIIGFIIGSELHIGLLRRMGRTITTVLLAQFFGAFLLVTLGVYFLTPYPLYVALLFGALATATAPAGTVIVLQEYRAKGSLTDTLLAIVGLDDALAIMVFGFVLAVTRTLIGGGGSASFLAKLVEPLREIGGAILLGGIIGIVLAYIIRGMRRREEVLVVSLGTILLCTGLAKQLNISLILSNMVMGITASSTFLRASRRSFEAIQGIAPPIYIAFFVLAGAHLQIKLLLTMGLLGAIYVLGRSMGKMGGAYLGSVFSKAERNIKHYLGFGLLSQAGVAVSLAILVGREFGASHELAILIISTIVASDILFEIIGPIATKFAITRAGEAGKSKG